MDEIGGAVERVDDPDIVGILCALGPAGFFGPNRMSWVGRQQDINDGLLSCLVYLSDKVVHLFLRHSD